MLSWDVTDRSMHIRPWVWMRSPFPLNMSLPAVSWPAREPRFGPDLSNLHTWRERHFAHKTSGLVPMAEVYENKNALLWKGLRKALQKAPAQFPQPPLSTTVPVAFSDYSSDKIMSLHCYCVAPYPSWALSPILYPCFEENCVTAQRASP